MTLPCPEYYKVRGWVDAFPTEETLARLGLENEILEVDEEELVV